MEGGNTPLKILKLVVKLEMLEEFGEGIEESYLGQSEKVSLGNGRVLREKGKLWLGGDK